MPRYAYKIGVAYPARLLAADTRPIENGKNSNLALVRLEFEIFQVLERDRELRSTGQIACRDLVLWPGAADDFGVVPFARALGVGDLCKPVAWSARAAEGAWIEIVFGEADEHDGRNRFAGVRTFSPDGYTVVEYRYDLSGDWLRPEDAGKAVGKSASTIRRFTKKHLAEFGELLERRTAGGHRLINIVRLRHLLKDPAWLDAARIESAQRFRELQKENAELKRRLRET
jgi:hypothetical protein